MGLTSNSGEVGMITMDDFKVGFAAVAGVFNWAANIDVVLQLLISIASLTYICLKIREILRRY